MMNETPFAGADLRSMEKLIEEYEITVEVQTDQEDQSKTTAVWNTKREWEEKMEERKKRAGQIIRNLMGENPVSVLSTIAAQALITVLMGRSEEEVAERTGCTQMWTLKTHQSSSHFVNSIRNKSW